MNKRLLFALSILLAATLACRAVAVGLPSPGGDSPSDPGAATAEARPQPTATLDANRPCFNALYPFAPDRQWVYKIVGEEGENRIGVTVAEVGEGQATVNALNVATGIVSQTMVTCEQSAIVNYPLMTMNMLFGDYVDSSLSVEHVSGVFSPANDVLLGDDWQVAWDGAYTAHGTLKVTGEGEEFVITLRDSPVRMHWYADGTREAVTVAAGTFPQAVRVQREMEVDITLDAQGTTVQGTLKVKTMHWFEPFVGLLKSQVESASVTYMGIEFPVVLTGSVELVEYRSGN